MKNRWEELSSTYLHCTVVSIDKTFWDWIKMKNIEWQWVRVERKYVQVYSELSSIEVGAGVWESARVFRVKSEMLLRELECCSTCTVCLSVGEC